MNNFVYQVWRTWSNVERCSPKRFPDSNTADFLPPNVVKECRKDHFWGCFTQMAAKHSREHLSTLDHGLQTRQTKLFIKGILMRSDYLKLSPIDLWPTGILKFEEEKKKLLQLKLNSVWKIYLKTTFQWNTIHLKTQNYINEKEKHLCGLRFELDHMAIIN